MAVAEAPMRCTECGRGLTRHQAVAGGLCGLPACRRSRSDRERSQRFQALATQARSADGLAANAWPAVELLPHDLQRVPVPAAVRQEHAAWLASLADAVQALAATAPAAPSADEPGPAWTGRLCAACQGRCCRHGAHSHGYLDAEVVARWRSAQPGMTVAEALAAYEARVPEQHLAGSCVYHGDRGCTLTRGMRSDTCNEFACAGLQSARRKAKRDGVLGVVALTWDGRSVQAQHRVAADAAD